MNELLTVGFTVFALLTFCGGAAIIALAGLVHKLSDLSEKLEEADKAQCARHTVGRYPERRL